MLITSYMYLLIDGEAKAEGEATEEKPAEGGEEQKQGIEYKVKIK